MAPQLKIGVKWALFTLPATQFYGLYNSAYAVRSQRNVAESFIDVDKTDGEKTSSNGTILYPQEFVSPY